MVDDILAYADGFHACVRSMAFPKPFPLANPFTPHNEDARAKAWDFGYQMAICAQRFGYDEPEPDTSDIPEATEEWFAQAKMVKPVSDDEDALYWCDGDRKTIHVVTHITVTGASAIRRSWFRAMAIRLYESGLAYPEIIPWGVPKRSRERRKQALKQATR